MSTEYRLYQPHAVPALHIDDTERELGAAWLRRAHAEGRVSRAELDRRLALVDAARDRGELNTAFVGLVARPQGATAAPPAATLRPRRRVTHPVSMAAHLSVFPLWLLGPALFYAVAPRGSAVRREAAKAFNAQVVWLLVGLVGTVAQWAMAGGPEHDLGAGMGLGPLWLVWFVLTVLAAVRAGRGEDWRNPVNRIVPVKPLRPE